MMRLMKITHVLRGEDLLPSTPRQIALHRALIRIGVGDRVPEYAHLPTVLGDGTKKLSKRDPQSNLFLHRDRGFIPEGLLNYLALLGWGIADDHDIFSLEEMVARLRCHRRQLQPGPVRSEKSRRHQRRAHPAFERGRVHRSTARVFRRPRLRHRSGRGRISRPPPNWCRRASWCCPTRGIC